MQLWLYYAFMATVGSVAGGFGTYRLARKGGKETLARRFPPKTAEVSAQDIGQGIQDV